MGMYINPGNDGFKTCVAGDYIDKTGLIAIVNSTIGTKDKLSCVSRARRFGKSMAAQMLCAYYDKSCDSRELFQGLEITKNSDYDKYLNKYNVLYIDVTSFIGEGGLTEVVNNIRKAIIRELAEAFSFIDQYENVVDALGAVVESGEAKFIAIIDEWDAVIRDRHSTNELQYDYLEFLRSLFKSSGTTDKIFDAAYMTGILPIKKDGSQSAISEFREYTMLDPGEFAPYFGFNEDEVKFICEDKGVDFSQMKKWYDGYSFKGVESVYNPNSVIYAAKKRSFKSYWQMSSSARSLEGYINMDFDGLADTVVDLLGGRSVPIKTKKFQNDLTSLQSKDDVLTLLTHFGYLAYDDESGTIRIPNEEIREEFADMVHDITHVETLKRVKLSDKLIEDVINMNDIINSPFIIEEKPEEEEKLNNVLFEGISNIDKDNILELERHDGNNILNLKILIRKLRINNIIFKTNFGSILNKVTRERDFFLNKLKDIEYLYFNPIIRNSNEEKNILLKLILKSQFDSTILINSKG
jgi:hypothetical protein